MGKEAKDLVREYIRQDRIDFTGVASAGYLDELQAREDVWNRHLPKNFKQNIR
jgi:hypothetical protein